MICEAARTTETLMPYFSVKARPAVSALRASTLATYQVIWPSFFAASSIAFTSADAGRCAMNTAVVAASVSVVSLARRIALLPDRPISDGPVLGSPVVCSMTIAGGPIHRQFDAGALLLSHGRTHTFSFSRRVGSARVLLSPPVERSPK